MTGLIEFELVCPICHQGKMLRTGEKVQGIIHRRCNKCAHVAKYQRFKITDVGSVVELVLKQDQEPFYHG